MQGFINIALGTDKRWRRVENGQMIDGRPTTIKKDTFASVYDSGIAYRRENGCHIFSCVKQMNIEGSGRPELVAETADTEMPFRGRIFQQLRLPDWYEHLGEDNDKRGTIMKKLSDFSEWVRDEYDDAWIAPQFDMTLLARIADKLLTAIKNNERAKIVLACNSQNAEKAREVMYYAFRCLPVKLANRLTFNTASAQVMPYDICCGNQAESEVIRLGGTWIDVERQEWDFHSFDNAYAEYIQLIDGKEDPCKGFEEKDNVDDLNAAVSLKVLEEKGKRLVAKCKTGTVMAAELADFAKSAKGSEESVEEQLQQLADYVCLNYTGFIDCYLNLTDEHRKFYASRVTNSGECPNWGNAENTDRCFAPSNDECKSNDECNSKYIKILYDFWLGEEGSTAYRGNKDIGQFLFSDYDERFEKNESLKNAFWTYWKSLGEEKLLEYLHHGLEYLRQHHKTVLNAEAVSEFIISHNDRPMPKFIEFYSGTEMRERIGEENVKRLCNKYLSTELNERGATDAEDLVRVRDKVEKILERDVAATLKTHIDTARAKNYQEATTYLKSNQKLDCDDTKIRDEKLARRWQKENKGTSLSQDDKIVIYNAARLYERDCGMSGKDHNDNKFGKLKGWERFTTIVFVICCVILGFVDICLWNKLYVFWEEWSFWLQIGVTMFMLLGGTVIWSRFDIKIHDKYRSAPESKPICDNERYKSELTQISKRLFTVSVVAIASKVIICVIAIILVS